MGVGRETCRWKPGLQTAARRIKLQDACENPTGLRNDSACCLTPLPCPSCLVILPEPASVCRQCQGNLGMESLMSNLCVSIASQSLVWKPPVPNTTTHMDATKCVIQVSPETVWFLLQLQNPRGAEVYSCRGLNFPRVWVSVCVHSVGT